MYKETGEEFAEQWRFLQLMRYHEDEESINIVCLKETKGSSETREERERETS